MKQPTPKVSEADVFRVAERDFGKDSVPGVLAILERYGTEDWQLEVVRVRLAILKVAGRDIVRLQSAADRAQVDYRDLLAPAEYPGYSRLSYQEVNDLPPDDQKRLIESDWKQYEDWLLG